MFPAKPDLTLDEMFKINKDEWMAEAKAREEYLSQFGEHLPQELKDENEGLKKRLA